jgi:hypothetical protein
VAELAPGFVGSNFDFQPALVLGFQAPNLCHFRTCIAINHQFKILSILFSSYYRTGTAMP